MDELPQVIPIFPLPNVVLFPHVELPLHIFEPRYRAMVDDAMQGDRLVDIVVLRGDWRRDYHGAPEVFPLGCVGRITNFSPLPDGRSNLVLRGERRFTIRDEVAGTEYRRARVDWQPCVPEEGATAAALERRLKDSVSRLLARRDRELTADFWDRLPRETERLVNSLASALDLPTIEKLALLECDAVRTRAERLLEVLEFHLAPGAPAIAGAADDEPRH